MPASLPLNPVLTGLPVYQPGRPIEEVAREVGLAPETIIKLASNENPFGPSRRALAAMRKAVRHANFYPDGASFYLKQKLAANLDLTPAQLIMGNGSNEIIELAGHALLSPGAEVVVSQYCFAVYPIVTHLFGAKLVSVPARNYAHDLEGMRDAITPRTRIMFVACPNNPTGTSAEPAGLERLVQSVPPEVLLVVDEAYIEFMRDSLDLLPAIRAGLKPNLLLMRTFSKIHGLAGLRVGYGIGHPGLIAELEKIRQPFNVNAVAQAGALAALDDSKHLQRTRNNNARGLAAFERAFRKLGLEFIPSSANFIVVKVGDGQRAFDEMQKRGVIVRPMASYQMPEWVRVTIGTPRQNKRCLKALKEVLGLDMPKISPDPTTPG